MGVEETLGHVDVGAVDEVVVQVEYVDGIRKVAAVLHCGPKKVVHGKALAAQVPVGVDDGDLDGVHCGRAQRALDFGEGCHRLAS